MLKKYLIPGLLLAGCAVVFVIFSLLVFITKGKSPRLLKQKLLLGVLLISLSGALASCQLDVSAVAQIVAPKKTRIITCYIAPPPTTLPTIKPTQAPTPMCYMPPPPTIAPTNKPTPINSPTCYIAPPPIESPVAKAKADPTTLCYVVIEPPVLASNNRIIPIKIPLCYFALPADKAEQAKAALAPHLCYAPVRLG